MKQFCSFDSSLRTADQLVNRAGTSPERQFGLFASLPLAEQQLQLPAATTINCVNTGSDHTLPEILSASSRLFFPLTATNQTEM